MRLALVAAAALFPVLGLSQAPSAVDSSGTSQRALTAPGLTINGPIANNGALTIATLSTPTTPTFATCTGVLTTGTYYYRVSATNAAGETLASTEGSKAIVSVTGLGVRGTWPQVTGATGYKFYGRTTGAEQLIATITGGTTLTYCDAGSISPSGALPSRNATADSTMAGNLAVTGTISGPSSVTNLTVTGNTQLGDASGDTFIAYPAALTLAKEINHTLGPVTSTTSNAAGANMTVSAGTATSGGSGNAGALVLNAGADGSALGGAVNVGAANTLSINLGVTGGTPVTNAWGNLTLYPVAVATGGATTKNSVDLATNYGYWTGSAAATSAGYSLRTVPSSAATAKGDLIFLDQGTTQKLKLTASTGLLTATGGVTVPSGATFISQAASGAVAFEMPQGAKFCLDSTTNSNCLSWSGSTLTTPGVLSTGSSIVAGGGSIRSPNQVYSNTGAFYAFNSDQYADLRGNAADGAGAIGVKVTQGVALTTSGAQALAVYSDAGTTKVAYVDKAGAASFSGGVTAVGRYVTSDSSQAFGAWSGHAIGLTSNGDIFDGPFFASSAWTVRRVACSSNIAGSGGTAGFVIRIRNVTDSSTLCTLTATTCNTTAHTAFQTDCNAAGLAGKHYRLEVDSSSDCAVYPTDTVCNVQMAQ